MPASAVKKTKNKRNRMNFQTKEKTKFCTDSKQYFSDFQEFASKMATIARLESAVAHCAGS